MPKRSRCNKRKHTILPTLQENNDNNEPEEPEIIQILPVDQAYVWSKIPLNTKQKRAVSFKLNNKSDLSIPDITSRDHFEDALRESEKDDTYSDLKIVS